jgi:hypothetical protein
MSKQLTLKFIGCEIIHREACALAARSPHKIDLQFLRKGLHDLKTPDMLATIQSAVDAAGAGYDAVILGYARCNDGLVGLTARRAPLVIARAHDCITFFFGSRQEYKAYFDAHPGTYYRTTGWSERNSTEGTGHEGVMSQLGLTSPYEEMVAKYGKENADYIKSIMGNWTANYNNLCYVRMDVCDEQALIADARAEADKNQWTFDLRPGSWCLLEKLFAGNWDEDFVIVQPGQHLVARNDDRVLDAE